jgi:hypothetical protein
MIGISFGFLLPSVSRSASEAQRLVLAPISRGSGHGWRFGKAVFDSKINTVGRTPYRQ